MIKGLWGLTVLWLTIWAGASPGVAQPARYRCPTELEPLVELMLRDLPSYANRVISRSRILSGQDSRTSVVLAGRPEFDPLSLGFGQPPPPPTADPQQVFFTTLERQYYRDRMVERQNFYWLFLTKTPSGWRVATLLTRLGTTSQKDPTPPRESHEGIMGQAVALWLRDCRAGAVKP
ncbi:hypothetical protein K4A83_08905 [Spirulina subsalsa FACHB-351]|uniref:Secreted protein n=1 Tax=Spirulina subsalsa FACHB-351 TaxID=234711 RepID=A0ABT3L4E8_9CYAN|nr:hypothetical protein [Spirulina subsalsa FACHB-351]